MLHKLLKNVSLLVGLFVHKNIERVMTNSFFKVCFNIWRWRSNVLIANCILIFLQWSSCAWEQTEYERSCWLLTDDRWPMAVICSLMLISSMPLHMVKSIYYFQFYFLQHKYIIVIFSFHRLFSTSVSHNIITTLFTMCRSPLFLPKQLWHVAAWTEPTQ